MIDSKPHQYLPASPPLDATLRWPGLVSVVATLLPEGGTQIMAVHRSIIFCLGYYRNLRPGLPRGKHASSEYYAHFISAGKTELKTPSHVSISVSGRACMYEGRQKP
jgi:hypothetical protein